MKTEISYDILEIDVGTCAVVNLALGILYVYPYKTCNWESRQAEVLIATE